MHVILYYLEFLVLKTFKVDYVEDEMVEFNSYRSQAVIGAVCA